MLTTYALDKYFDRFFDYGGVEAWNYGSTSNQYYQSETESEVTIEMSAMGVSRADLKIEVVDHVLTVEGKPQTKSKLVSGFKKSWTLGEHIDVGNIVAKLENGVLTLSLPKIKPVKKTVSINVS